MSLFDINSGKVRAAAGSAAAGLALCIGAAGPAHAQVGIPRDFAGSSGSDSAQAAFLLVTGTSTYLQVTLTNTSSIANPGTNDVLTSVFFDLTFSNGGTLAGGTYTAATAANTNVLNAVNCIGGTSGPCGTAGTSGVNLGYEYGHAYNSSGYSGIFTNGTITGTPHYVLGQWGAANTNSIPQVNLTRDGGPQLYGNGSLNNSVAFGSVGSLGAGSLTLPLANQTVIMDIPLISGSLLTASNVWFQYGYSPTSTINGLHTPEPSSLLMMGSGLIGYRLLRRRSKKARRKSV